MKTYYLKIMVPVEATSWAEAQRVMEDRLIESNRLIRVDGFETKIEHEAVEYK